MLWRSWVNGEHGSADSPPAWAGASGSGPAVPEGGLRCSCGKGLLMSRELEALARRVPLARRAGDDHLFGLMGEGLEELELVSRSEAEELRARCSTVAAAFGENHDVVEASEALEGSEVRLVAVGCEEAADGRAFEWRPKSICGSCLSELRAQKEVEKSAFKAATVKVQQQGRNVGQGMRKCGIHSSRCCSGTPPRRGNPAARSGRPPGPAATAHLPVRRRGRPPR